MASITDPQELLKAATDACGTLKTTADAHSDYSTLKAEVKGVYDQLEALPADQKKQVAEEIKQIKTKFDEAVKKAETDKKPVEAVALLKDLQKDSASAKLKSDMLKNLNSPAPNKDYLKLLVTESGGTDLLDNVVKGMDETTANRATLEAAMEVRFGLEMKQVLTEDYEKDHGVVGTSDKTAPDKSIKRIYELMLKVSREPTLKTTPR